MDVKLRALTRPAALACGKEEQLLILKLKTLKPDPCSDNAFLKVE